MNQVLIGKFISDERKRKGYSQTELAEKLGISNKTVSKWETGKGFPDVSLLLPLCEELNITVNELLSGERLSKEAYQKNAEENMVSFIEKNEKRSKEERIVCSILIILSMSVLFISIGGNVFRMLYGIVAIIAAVLNIACLIQHREAKWFRFISLSCTALTLCGEYGMIHEWVKKSDWAALSDVVPTVSKLLWFLTIASILVNGISLFFKTER